MLNWFLVFSGYEKKTKHCKTQWKWHVSKLKTMNLDCLLGNFKPLHYLSTYIYIVNMNIVCMYIYIYVNIRTFVCKYIYIYMYTYIYMHMYISLLTLASTFTYYMYIYITTYVWLCVYTYEYIIWLFWMVDPDGSRIKTRQSKSFGGRGQVACMRT